MDQIICSICHHYFDEKLSLFNYFKQKPLICQKCIRKMKKIDARRCKHCHKILHAEEKECNDCAWLHKYFQPVDRIDCLYDYESVKDVLHQYKFNKDIFLAASIASLIKVHDDLLKGYDYIIPMPSSPNRIVDRGFDHMHEIGKFLKCRPHPLKMNDRKKQHELTKYERAMDENPFYLAGPINGRILLIDDIYTTGLTVHRAAEILRKNEIAYIGVITFARA